MLRILIFSTVLGLSSLLASPALADNAFKLKLDTEGRPSTSLRLRKVQFNALPALKELGLPAQRELGWVEKDFEVFLFLPRKGSAGIRAKAVIGINEQFKVRPELIVPFEGKTTGSVELEYNF
jgi:hypothetical protein